MQPPNVSSHKRDSGLYHATPDGLQTGLRMAALTEMLDRRKKAWLRWNNAGWERRLPGGAGGWTRKSGIV